MAIIQGNVAKFSVVFRDTDTNDPLDPTGVSFSYNINGGSALNTWTYTSATVPAIGVVARLSTGSYEVWVDTTGLLGTMVGTFTAVGTGQAVVPTTVVIVSSTASPNTTTLSTMINQVIRRIQPGQVVETLALASNYTAGATTIMVSDPSGVILPSLQPEVTIAIDLEIFYVQAVSGTTVTVVPGYLGSQPSDHSVGTLVYLNPRFSAFDIMCAINDDLNDLSSPENGLYTVNSLEFTYNPATVGYDLAGATGFIDVISVQQKQPYPIGYWVPIPRRKWTVTASADPVAFPSGFALRLNEGGYPGMPFRVTYKSSFQQFSALSDDASIVAGLSPTMYDLPPLGAMVALVAPREVKRNQIDSAPDARRATEVPPGAVMNSVAQVLALRQRRIKAEASRLQKLYGAQAGR